jgi:recombination protein RecA
MAQNRWQKLESAVAGIQKRYGGMSIYRADARAPTPPPVLRTGFQALDAALGIGGLPRGRISELIGRGTAGHHHVALSAVKMAQRAAEQAVYVDVARTVDLSWLAGKGVRLDALTILRPAGIRPALDMLCDLAENSGAGVIILDGTNDLLADPRELYWLMQALRRLNGQAAHSSGAVIFIGHADAGRPETWSLPGHVAVRLLFEHLEWKTTGRRISGFVTRVTIAKNQLSPAGGPVNLHMAL